MSDKPESDVRKLRDCLSDLRRKLIERCASPTADPTREKEWHTTVDAFARRAQRLAALAADECTKAVIAPADLRPAFDLLLNHNPVLNLARAYSQVDLSQKPPALASSPPRWLNEVQAAEQDC